MRARPSSPTKSAPRMRAASSRPPATPGRAARSGCPGLSASSDARAGVRWGGARSARTAMPSPGFVPGSASRDSAMAAAATRGGGFTVVGCAGGGALLVSGGGGVASVAAGTTTISPLDMRGGIGVSCSTCSEERDDRIPVVRERRGAASTRNGSIPAGSNRAPTGGRPTSAPPRRRPSGRAAPRRTVYVRLER